MPTMLNKNLICDKEVRNWVMHAIQEFYFNIFLKILLIPDYGHVEQIYLIVKAVTTTLWGDCDYGSRRSRTVSILKYNFLGERRRWRFIGYTRDADF